MNSSMDHSENAKANANPAYHSRRTALVFSSCHARTSKEAIPFSFLHPRPAPLTRTGRIIHREFPDMQVIFIPREGIDLYATLLQSETSRDALRFYQPRQGPAGVEIAVASLGSALSLASDLRWYVRRYMMDVLFRLDEGVYSTQALARQIYFGRAAVLHRPWKYRRIYRFREGRICADDPYTAKGKAGPPAENGEVSLVVWCTPEEFRGERYAAPEEDAEENGMI